MRSLGLLSLVVVLAICYLLYFHAEQSERAGLGAASAQSQNGDVYKADMDRAHAAAQLMVKSHKESEAY